MQALCDIRYGQQGYEVKDVGRKSNVAKIVCWNIRNDSEFRSRVARSNRLVGTADPLSECMQKLANVCGCFAMWHHENSEILKELAIRVERAARALTMA